MSTSIENLRRASKRDLRDHTAIFDLYVTVGRDIEYLSLKFGMNPDEVIYLLEGYGEKILTGDLGSASRCSSVTDDTGRGRLRNLSRRLIEEYVERFYPGIDEENEENDWICLESYLDIKHPGWRGYRKRL